MIIEDKRHEIEVKFETLKEYPHFIRLEKITREELFEEWV